MALFCNAVDLAGDDTLELDQLGQLRRLAGGMMAHAINELNVEFPATFEEWEREQTHPDTGEVIGGVCP